jgi:hypothetical protein
MFAWAFAKLKTIREEHTMAFTAAAAHEVLPAGHDHQKNPEQPKAAHALLTDVPKDSNQEYWMAKGKTVPLNDGMVLTGLKDGAPAGASAGSTDIHTIDKVQPGSVKTVTHDADGTHIKYGAPYPQDKAIGPVVSETVRPDGTRVLVSGDGSTKIISPDGKEKVMWDDNY